MFRFPNFFILVVLSILLFSCEKRNKNEHFSSMQHSKTVTDTLFRSKADDFYNKQKYDSAFLFYNKFKTIAESNRDTANVCYAVVRMADNQQRSGDYFGSEATLIEILPFLQKYGDYRAAAYNLLGVSNKELGNYKEAIKNYREAENYSNEVLAQLTIDNNIGLVLIEENKIHEAIALFETILKNDYINKPQFQTRKARVLDNLGFAYFKNGNEATGLHQMKESLLIRQKENDSYGSIESYLHLTEFYLKKNKNQAAQYAKKAYEEATKSNSIDERLKALLYLIKVSQEKQLLLQYATLNDSINFVRNRTKNQFAKIKYDAKVTQEENLKLKNTQIQTELELQKSENEKDFWLVLVVLLISFVLFLFNYFKNKNRQEKQKATYFTETRIAKKIHDELANDVFQTISYIETKSIDEPQHKEELINLLDNIYQRSRNISKENESIETGEYFNDALIAMINSYKTNQCNVIIKKDETINWQNLLAIKKITIFRVLQELLINMKKHSQATIVVVSFASGKNDINIDYSDNGKGLDFGKVKKSGLSNVENRIKNINGKITFDSLGKGLKIKIIIPK